MRPVNNKKNDYTEQIEKLALYSEQNDNSKANSSSIAFLFKNSLNVSILFAGDANSNIIIKSLNNLGYDAKNNLKLNYWKLSHHGSKRSTSRKLLEIIECENYLISTNGFFYNLPNKTTFARILTHRLSKSNEKNTNFYFNYDNNLLRSIINEQEKCDFNVNCYYPLKDSILEIKH